MEVKWDNLIGVATTIQKEGIPESEGEVIPRVIETARVNGFKVIEIMPAQFTALTRSEGTVFLKKVFGPEQRRKLKEQLKTFDLVTVHGSNINIRVDNGVDDQELWEPYLELMRFARDIGARFVTFHSLKAGADISEAELAARHVKFGKVAAARAEEWGLLSGFEFATSYEFFLRHKIIPSIGSRHFRALVDVGHIALFFPESNLTEKVLHVMEQCLDYTLEIHGGGVQMTSRGLKEHRPLDKHNLLDHGQLIRLLERNGFQGPIVFEIFNKTEVPEQVSASLSENLRACLEAQGSILKGENRPF